MKILISGSHGLVGSALVQSLVKDGHDVVRLVRHNPQKRLVAPAEVADAVLWLCGDGARSVTGQAIAVAGGEV